MSWYSKSSKQHRLSHSAAFGTDEEKNPLFPSKKKFSNLNAPGVDFDDGLAESGMKRPQVMGRFGLVFFAFFLISGGPWGLEDMIASGGPFYTFLSLVIFPIIWALPVILITAELSSAIPSNFGPISWLQKGLGNYPAFQIGIWLYISQLFDAALYPKLVSVYGIDGGLPVSSSWFIPVVKLVAMIITTTITIFGVQITSRIIMVAGALVLMPLLLLIGGAARHCTTADFMSHNSNVNWAPFAMLSLWSINGWDLMGNVVANFSHDRKRFVFPLLMAWFFVIFFDAVPLTVASCLNTDYSAWSEGYLSHVSLLIGGTVGKTTQIMVIVSAMVTSVMSEAVSLITLSEMLCGLVQKDLLNIPFMTTISKWGTPARAIIFNSLAIFGFSFLPYDNMVGFSTSLYSVALIAEIIAFLVLKFRKPEMKRPFEVPGGRIVAVLISIPPVVIALLSIFLTETYSKIFTCGIIIGSVALFIIRIAILKIYAWWQERRRHGHRHLTVQ